MEIFRNYLLKKVNVLTKELKNIRYIVDFYNRDKKYECYGVYKIFKQIDEQLGILEKKIKNIKKTAETEKKGVEFFILYDYNREEIIELLEYIDMIYKNLIQTMEIGLNQYLPRPNLNRAYSYMSINEYLLTSLNTFVKKILNNEKVEVSIYWEHLDTLKNYKLENHFFFSSSYYHQDIPQLFSIMGHELGHLLLRKEYSPLKRLKEKIKVELVGSLDVRRAISLAEEISCDIYASLMYGNGFLITALVELGAKGFKNSFFDEDNDRSVIVPFEDNRLRDDSIIRLIVLYLTIKDTKIKKFYEKYIETIMKDLKSYYEDKGEFFANNIKNQIDFYKGVAVIVSKVIDNDRSLLTRIYNDITYCWDNQNTLYSRDIYTILWDQVLKEDEDNKVYLAGKFREELLKEFLDKIEYKEIKHKIAIFGKVANYKIEYTNTIESFYKKKNFLFGIYNFFEIIDVNDDIDSFDGVNFFIYQNLLMQIGEGVGDKNKDEDFNLALTVRLDENCRVKNVLDSVKFFKSKLDGYNYILYKSLGPKELFCVIEKLSIQRLYEIKLCFAKHFKKTHSFIYLSKKIDSKKEIDIGDDYEVRVVVRSKKDFETSKYKSKNYKISCTTGIYDYEFRWEKSFKMKDFYEIIADKGVSDVQIKIDKKDK